MNELQEIIRGNTTVENIYRKYDQGELRLMKLLFLNKRYNELISLLKQMLSDGNNYICNNH